ncbi:uncharacterized protein LOC130744826 [Lotus japonicus]|uniref:uncharacterized protein LOC130744826 n=1 Tax=Lotus japonicus TaxID=34305 RepID=UPI00258A4A6F|nr:uncharacterized protein LOC130744826 [Lotus japonicus]XP_057452966.1 uncharacterized protein LOC130744826 [Lotus japonicus]
MASSDVCPPEDAVKAFIEHLVDSMLPSKPTQDNPSLSQLQEVAKQVRSVVLLYNYYHRKQHPELAFLAFDEFCKLAVDLNPTLSAHIKPKQIPDEMKLVDADVRPSLIEKEILNACNICACLDASKNVPDIEGWPISKVSVLLIDNKNENFYLNFGSITQGVWSMVEKDMGTSAQSCEVATKFFYTYKKRKSVQKTSKNELNVGEDRFLQAGYAAVKEAAGLNKTDIMLMGSYTVYSQSKEKTASRFYIMKCSQTQLINKEFTPIPIKDVIERLRGPLVQRSINSWIVTSAVEYFHMLPYSEIISEWISRETSSNSLQASKLAEKNMMVESPEVTELFVSSEGVSVGLDNQIRCDTIEALNQKENNGCKEAQDMDVDNSSVLPSENIEECQIIANNLQVIEYEEIENSAVQHYKMASSDVCPPEDAVKAFVEFLVDPMLPSKPTRDKPSPSQQQKVAKQVHSVVLLYNYYHRKQHPELAFLTFDEFCKLAVELKPTLSAHIKSKQIPDEMELVDEDERPSLTENEILNACNTCACLDASKNVPDTEGWPISKVVVLLIDNKNEYFYLNFGSITQGVWSMVEKDVDTSTQSCEVTTGTKYTYTEGRSVQKTSKNEFNVGEDSFLQAGYAAVKEAAGVNKTDIMLLESYTVYSQSKEKTASRFYIMKCSQTQLINKEFTPIPIKDVIERLQGPLVQRSFNSWIVTSVVEYFHMLPYSEIISEWISRETSSHSLQASKMAENNVMAESPEVTELYVSGEGLSVCLDNQPRCDTTEDLNQKENNGCKEARDMDVDNSLVLPSEDIEECQNITNNLQVVEYKEIENSSVQHYSNGSTSPFECLSSLIQLHGIGFEAKKVDSMIIPEGGINDQSALDKICANTTLENNSIEDCALIAKKSNLDLDKLQIFLASKMKTLSQTALNALIGKRNALALQLRMIADEIALCDMKIQRISGGEDVLALKIDSIIEGCNDTWVRNQGSMCPLIEDQCFPPYAKRKRLTDAVLMQSPCQELDGVCHANNWILPTYSLSQSAGGFQANLTVKGPDFESSCGGNICCHPREARESAAAQMLVNLRSMARSAQ